MVRCGFQLGIHLLRASRLFLFGMANSIIIFAIVQSPAKSQSIEAAAEVAKAITVRIEGATQGSGVLIQKSRFDDSYIPLPDGLFEYKVISAWHVLKSNQKGEEINLVTPDGKRYFFTIQDVKRIRDFDLAVFRFKSRSQYQTADTSTIDLYQKAKLLVAGFPLDSSQELTITSGKLVGEATFSLGGGYQILYSNRTSAGMSGGPVLNAEGDLIGIHGQGERDSVMTSKAGKDIKTGVNLGIPSYYIYLEDESFQYNPNKNSTPTLPSDFILMAEMSARKDSSNTQKVVDIYNQGVEFAIASGSAFDQQYMYFGRANAKRNNADFNGVIEDVSILSLANKTVHAVPSVTAWTSLISGL